MSLHIIHPRTDGSSRATALRAVRRGELLTLRPGVFLRRAEWDQAPPWSRHLAMTAAAGLQRPARIFCRQTALVLYGVPLLGLTREVHARASSDSRAGVSGGPGPRGLIPVRTVRPPVPRTGNADCFRGLFREQVRVGGGWLPVPDVRLDGGGEVRVQVEPLPLVLMDTVPRLGTQEAVVILDAVLGGRSVLGRLDRDALAEAQQWLWSSRARAAWERALGFADPRSESPGESRSRVLIDELGFAPPQLQTVLRLPDGGTARLDFEWMREGVVGEFDGRIKFTEASRLSQTSPGEVYWAQVRREEAIRDTGRRLVRWEWDDLNRPR